MVHICAFPGCGKKMSYNPKTFHRLPLCEPPLKQWLVVFKFDVLVLAPETVQIMIGVVEFLFGIVTAIYPAISTLSGVAFWGAIIYIITGSLSVAAHKQLNPCLVKASLGMNIVSTVAAGISIIMHTLDMVVPLLFFYGGCYDGYGYRCHGLQALRSKVMGIAGVMLVLSILEFIVSICISVFACKATCSSGTEPQVMYVSNQVPSYVPYASAPLQSSSEVPLLPTSVNPSSYQA